MSKPSGMFRKRHALLGDTIEAVMPNSNRCARLVTLFEANAQVQQV